jgi:hypothetical protein
MSDPAVTSARPTRLDPDAVLQRVPNVRLLLTAADTVKVRLPEGVLDCGPLGMRLLEGFQRPTSVRDVLDGLDIGMQGWMDALNTIAGLVDHGVLRDPHQRAPDAEVRSYGFDNPRPHIEMLDDVARTRRFIEAIEATVGPGDVVVDIGTGTGVLAMAAARAGAARVYAIEAGAIADRAERLFAENGFSEIITLVRGWSTSVELPEPADVLVTETIGSDPLDERILEIVTDARRRLLVPDARIIPSSITIYGTAVEVPVEDIAAFVYTEGKVRRWRDSYGFDFEPLLQPERRVRDYRLPMTVTRAWRPLTSSVALVTLELSQVTSVSVTAAADVLLLRSGTLDGTVLHFDAELAPGVRISSDAHGREQVPSWSNVITLNPPEAVEEGQRVRLSYGWGAPRRRDGLTVETDQPDASD